MNRFTLLSMLFFLSFGCDDPCRYLDCSTDNYEGRFRFLEAHSGKDLLFGRNSPFKREDLKVFSIDNGDTTYYQIQYFAHTQQDSALKVDFYKEPDKVYFKLSNRETDTIRIAYKTSATKCCGNITEITHFRINDSLTVDFSYEPIVIKK